MCNISKACEAIKTDRNTFYRWIEKDLKFKVKIAEVDESLIDMAECQLYKNVKSGMQKAVEFFLCNRKKDKYNNNQQVEFIIPKVVHEIEFVQKGEAPEIVETNE